MMAKMIYRVHTTFPDSAANTFGMFYNGRTSRVDVSIHNKESQPIFVLYIGGAFQDTATLKPVHNVSSLEGIVLKCVVYCDTI